VARPRTIPDSAILAAVRSLLSAGGEKAVAFSSVAQASGLAAASLAQRYGGVQGMIEAAAKDAVDVALSALVDIEVNQPDKGPQGLLKLMGGLGPDASALAVLMRSPAGRARADAFRLAVESALARRLGPKAAASAPLLFAAWSGGQMWATSGEPAFKLKDAVKKMG
jgi:AcrR family transcriptional regulator